RWPHGALLTLASGSGPNRQTSVVFGLNAKGEPQKTPNPIDMKPLVASLGEQFPDVNLEGAVRLGDRLRLFQRGNQGVGKNALIDLDLKSVMDAVTQGQPLDDSMVREVRPLELGEVNGVGLTLSDASPLDDGRVVFSAVAEDTQSSYTDGEFAGACLGILSADGNVEKLWSVPDHKIEGVHAEPTRGGGIRVWMVADADDPNAVSPLMTAHLPDPKTD
ncbi:MAG: DUF6910 family protein, partial [Myxococcaceae bacterium]